jgi:CRP/FNR family transcriptional regulator, cyclic AMP receptor protein
VAVPSDSLARVPLFALLDSQEQGALADRLEEIREPAATLLFHAGDPGGSLYIVLEGEVELSFKNVTGERLLLQRARAGDFFGEISLLDGGPRTASALVTEDLHAVVIDREGLEQFLAVCPRAAMDLMAGMGTRMRKSATLLRGTASRNVNVETEDKRSHVQKVAEWISDFSGSLSFLLIHLVLFAAWIVLNIPPLSRTSFGGWDAYPFGLLTMSVSLEAIILSVFVLFSQSRQVARDRVRNDIEYDINLKAELEVAHLHEKVDRLYEQMQHRMHGLERSSSPRRSLPPRRADS